MFYWIAVIAGVMASAAFVVMALGRLLGGPIAVGFAWGLEKAPTLRCGRCYGAFASLHGWIGEGDREMIVGYDEGDSRKKFVCDRCYIALLEHALHERAPELRGRWFEVIEANKCFEKKG